MYLGFFRFFLLFFEIYEKCKNIFENVQNILPYKKKEIEIEKKSDQQLVP